ncbi:unnamed protein product [Urochloa humidicola]
MAPPCRLALPDPARRIQIAWCEGPNVSRGADYPSRHRISSPPLPLSRISLAPSLPRCPLPPPPPTPVLLCDAVRLRSVILSPSPPPPPLPPDVTCFFSPSE